MRFKQLAFILIFFLLNAFAFSQGTQKEPRIEKITFEGLKRTKTSYLLSFINTLPGTVPVDSIIQRDVQTLKNMVGIGDARYQLDTVDGQFQLTFFVDELRTLLPIVNFGGIRDNFWFQLGFADDNWAGRGQFLTAFYQNNDSRHNGQIYYRVPYFKNTQWGFSASLTRWASREPLFFPEGTVNYDYDFNSVALTVIRHFGIHRGLEIGGNYFVEKYTKSASQFLENPPGPDGLRQPKFLSKFEYSENFLNYHFFYLSGLSWRVNLQNVFNTLDNTWFNSLQFQGRQFTRIGAKGNLAMRLRLAISTNNDTPFAPFVLDSHVNIRGVGNRIDRGTAQVVLNAEYRHTIFDTNKWAAQSVVFSDSGTWRKPGGELSDLLDSEQFRQFIGGGFRVIYKKYYGAVFRVDYGVDIFNKKQRGVVLGLGQYF
ncbi:MAG: hypothetical protein AAFZ15_25795 [Bacteroidota bacterium]